MDQKIDKAPNQYFKTQSSIANTIAPVIPMDIHNQIIPNKLPTKNDSTKKLHKTQIHKISN